MSVLAVQVIVLLPVPLLAARFVGTLGPWVSGAALTIALASLEGPRMLPAASSAVSL